MPGPRRAPSAGCSGVVVVLGDVVLDPLPGADEFGPAAHEPLGATQRRGDLLGVRREWLQDLERALVRDHHRLVRRAHPLLDELDDIVEYAVAVEGQDVLVVEVDRDEARLPGRRRLDGCADGKGRRRHRRRRHGFGLGRPRRARVEREVRQELRLAVLEDLEILLLEACGPGLPCRGPTHPR